MKRGRERKRGREGEKRGVKNELFQDDEIGNFDDIDDSELDQYFATEEEVHIYITLQLSHDNHVTVSTCVCRLKTKK